MAMTPVIVLQSVVKVQN